MVEWRETTWGAEISLEYGKGIRGYADAVGPYRVFGSNGPVGWTSEPLAPGPGVILGRKGAYRGVQFSKEPFFVIDTAYYVVPKSELDIRWLYYAIIHHKLGEIDDGSPIPSTTRAAVYVRDLSVPRLEEQEAIASVLGALDDKIELNRRMNETLEAMARAIFKDWFVDFGPTRAKMEGRAPYLAPDIWSLFPDRLDDENKPEGWTNIPLHQVADIVKGRSYKSIELQPSRTALVTLKSFARGGGYRSEGLKPYTGPYKPDQVVSEGDLIVALTDVTQAAELIGRPAKVLADPRFDTLVASLDVAIIRPKQESLATREFLFGTMATEEFTLHTYAHTSGTTVLHLSKDAIPSFRFNIPNSRLLSAYKEIAAPLFVRIAANERESRTLAATRDFLLPKLMSGEVRVKEAQGFVEEEAWS